MDPNIHREEIRDEVNVADNSMLATEARDLLHGGPRDDWTSGFIPVKERIIRTLSCFAAFGRFAQHGVDLGLWTYDQVNREKFRDSL